MNERELRLESNLSLVLSLVLKDRAKATLLSRLPKNIFKDEDAVLVAILNRFKNDSVKLDKKFIEIFLLGNKRLITHTNNVDLSVLDEFQSYPVEEYIKLVIRRFEELSDRPITEEELKNIELVILTIIEDYKVIESLNVVDNARTIILDSYREGRKELSGVDDALDFAHKNLTLLQNVGAVAKQEYTVSARAIYEAAKVGNGIEKSEIVSDFGNIPTLNKAYGGGLRTGYFYNIMGGNKAGKTKLCTRILHTALVKYKVNAYAVLLEGGGFEKLISELRAIHYEWYYCSSGKFSNVSKSEFLPLSAQEIKDNLYPSESIRIMEEESFADLMSPVSGYGELFTPNDEVDITVENLKDILDAVVRSDNNIKFFLIDYLQIVPFDSKRYTKSAAISEVYGVVGTFTVRNKVCFLSPAQIKQEALNELNKAKDDEFKDFDARLAAGESAEITRRVDGNIMLYASPASLANSEAFILPAASRIAQMYPATRLHIDFRYNGFYEILGDETDRL